jgi:hypothetical protein
MPCEMGRQCSFTVLTRCGRHLLASDDMEAVCYLCLDGGFLEPLRRDCACRGTDAGFVHLSCLTKYSQKYAGSENESIQGAMGNMPQLSSRLPE